MTVSPTASVLAAHEGTELRGGHTCLTRQPAVSVPVGAGPALGKGMPKA